MMAVRKDRLSGCNFSNSQANEYASAVVNSFVGDDVRRRKLEFEKTEGASLHPLLLLPASSVAVKRGADEFGIKAGIGLAQARQRGRQFNEPPR